MNRPVTPENKSEIYQDSTICKLKQSITVRIVDSILPSTVHCPGIGRPYHTLPAGSIVIVSGSRKLNFTGTNDLQSTENTAYRIEGEIEMAVYEESAERAKVFHSEVRAVVPSNHASNAAFSEGTIVALKQNKTKTLLKGEVFVTDSKAQTPRGQAYSSRHPIEGALYEVIRVRKNIRRFKVKNSGETLIMHNDLERVPRVQ